jgi:very-short-patch-repair endonuclease
MIAERPDKRSPSPIEGERASPQNPTAPAEGRSILRSPQGEEGSGGGNSAGDEGAFTRAQLLRKNSTGPERKLWAALGRLKRDGFRFRRQVEFGHYIVDFVSHRERLVIEVDGAQHYEEKQQEYDTRRTRFLEAGGYLVLRYSNYDVLQNIDGVMRGICEVLTQRKRLKFSNLTTAVPPPDPSSPDGSEGSTAPQRGR